MSHDHTKDKAHPSFHYFDQRQLDLQEELMHPANAKYLENLMSHDDITVQLAQLATDLEIILDGAYDQNDLCQLLANKLKERRTQEGLIVVPPSGRVST